MAKELRINTIGQTGFGNDYTSAACWEAATDIEDIFRVLLVTCPDEIEEEFQGLKSYIKQFPADSLLITGTGQMLWSRFLDRIMTLSESASLSNEELQPFEDCTLSDLRIWRYLPFPKFMSMLVDNSLYFARGDNFVEDRYEGSIPKANINSIVKSEDNLKRIEQSFRNLYEHTRKWTYVSCWHASQYESPAMWSKYGRDGICIQSTVGKLRGCLNNQARLYQVHYIDYEKERIPITHLFHPFLHKRKYFEYEHEIRALMFEPEDAPVNGRHINVKLSDLIDHIFVNPLSEAWFFDLVRKLTKNYGLNENTVILSDLNSAPFFEEK